MYQLLCSVYALLAVYHHLIQPFAYLQNKKLEIMINPYDNKKDRRYKITKRWHFYLVGHSHMYQLWSIYLLLIAYHHLFHSLASNSRFGDNVWMVGDACEGSGYCLSFYLIPTNPLKTMDHHLTFYLIPKILFPNI
jgi:hypothetical protein